MIKYYGLATNEYGKNFIIDNLPEDRISARKEAEAFCKRTGMKFEGIRPVSNKQRGGDTMQKRFANGDDTPRKKGQAYKKRK